MMTLTEKYELASTMLNTVVGLRFASLTEAEKRGVISDENMQGHKARFAQAFALRESLPSLDVDALDGIIRDLGGELRSGGASLATTNQCDSPQINE